MYRSERSITANSAIYSGAGHPEFLVGVVTTPLKDEWCRAANYLSGEEMVQGESLAVGLEHG